MFVKNRRSLAQHKQEKLLEGQILRQNLRLQVNIAKAGLYAGQVGSQVIRKLLKKSTS